MPTRADTQEPLNLVPFVSGDILMHSSIFVEYPPQTPIEGEIQQLDVDHLVTELWQVVAGKVPGRTSAR